MVVVLDTGPLGMATNPNRSAPETERCAIWLEGLLLRGVDVVIPEIADYELRRELLRAGKVQGIARLDALVADLRYLPLTTPMMRKAAELWASMRTGGTPTAHNDALDGDVILAAQVLTAAGD